MSTDNKFTWRELKEKIGQIDDQFLDTPVIWWGEECAGRMQSLWILNEDYGDQGGDCQEARSDYKKYTGDGYKEEEFEVDYPKGTPILMKEI